MDFHKKRQMDRQPAHGQVDQEMTRHHYTMLGLNLVVSTIIMYLVMFTMNCSFGDFFNNLNMFYMALMMATPMGIRMLLMMRTMYPNDRLNVLLPAVFVLPFIVALLDVRVQGLIGERQFVRSMIPHHSLSSHVLSHSRTLRPANFPLAPMASSNRGRARSIR